MQILTRQTSTVPYYPFRSEPIFWSKVGWIGIFRCHPAEKKHYGSMKPISGHLIVFPRTCVKITFDGHEPIVTNPNIVMLYNSGQLFQRDKVAEDGDRCEYFGYRPSVLMEALESYYPTIDPTPEQPFVWSHTLTTTSAFLQQRRLVSYLRTHRQIDLLYVNEVMLAILQQVIEHGLKMHTVPTYRLGVCHKAQRRRKQIEVVREAQKLLSTRYDENLTLEQLSAELYISPFHLCRIFRKHTGMTIHQYLEQIRIRTAVELIPDCVDNLTHLAHTLGYSSHSHFTHAFRRAFGIPPSQYVIA